MNIDFVSNDQEIYKRELNDFLPSKLFDAHVHLLNVENFTANTNFPATHILRKFGLEYTLEQHLAYMKKMLPKQEIYLNSFGFPAAEAVPEEAAAYTGSISDNNRYFGMTMVTPSESVASVSGRIIRHKLVGYKPYSCFVRSKDDSEITIMDMISSEHLEFANENALAITLHIPRPGRLADPVNQRQMVELCHRYPDIAFIFAHIGRAYYLEAVTGQLEKVAACPNAYIDTAMVNHEGVLEYAFKVFPRDRILFGSDAPIAMLRGKSVEINNQYAYLTGEDYQIGTSIYDREHVLKFTFFYYEQLRAIIQAARRAGLSSDEQENIFFGNAFRLFSSVAKKVKILKYKEMP
ncbi:MAG: amidohydrolase family protein [Smithellaceae bacterium]|nr:amidohydrolase family protein [Smithellaceae bacterium]